jgi:hypothetical protein
MERLSQNIRVFGPTTISRYEAGAAATAQQQIPSSQVHGQFNSLRQTGCYGYNCFKA